MRLKRSTPFSSITPLRLRVLAPRPYQAFPVDKALPAATAGDGGGGGDPTPEPICAEGTSAQCTQDYPASANGIALGQFNVAALPGFELYPAFTYVRFRVEYTYAGVSDGVDTGTATFTATPSLVEAFINESETIDPPPSGEVPIAVDSVDVTPTSASSCVLVTPTVTVYLNGHAFELNHAEGDGVLPQVLVVGCATDGIGPPM